MNNSIDPAGTASIVSTEQSPSTAATAATTKTPLLSLESISCAYGSHEVFKQLSLQVETGSIACLLGPSGCGKTTALRAIAGFENIHSGRIMLDGKALSTAQQTLPPEQRQVGMVFQDYALFPHLSVADNIGFGLHTLPKAEKQAQVAYLLDLIRMEGYAKAWPHELSGGQQQRVALARALAPRPKLLLLDEPFSNLDTELRRSLCLEVRDILKRNGTTAVLVTHDQTEAFNMADVIGVMAAGKLLQWGSGQELYHHPATPFVASFISSGMLIDGILRSPTEVETALGLTALEQNQSDLSPGSPIRLLIRPWNIVHATTAGSPAQVISHQFNGSFTQTSLALPDGTTLSSHDATLATYQPGSQVVIALTTQHLQIFAANA